MRNRWWLVPVALLSVLFTVSSQALEPLVATAVESGGAVSIPAYGMDGPRDVTTGPDGALWFTNSYNNTIGRITTTGVVTNYTGNGIDTPQSITTGPDGALWFTNAANNSIGRITTTGLVTNYTGTGIDAQQSITSGPDGALWFTNDSSIGKITTAAAVSILTDPSITNPVSIANGPDGALWFTNQGSNSIERITTSGAVTSYTGTGIGAPQSITSGPDGALWFTNWFTNYFHALGTGPHGSIGRITTSGRVSDFKDLAIRHPDMIISGPDGALWFTNDDNAIGRVTVPAPELTSFSPTSGAVGTLVTVTGTALEGR
jgi:virginiamycin B lyase